MRILALVFSAALLLFGYVAQAETYYRWADPSGEVHLSNHDAPPGAETLRLPDLPLRAPPPPAVVEQWDSDRWFHPQPGGNVEHLEHDQYRTWMEPSGH